MTSENGGMEGLPIKRRGKSVPYRVIKSFDNAKDLLDYQQHLKVTGYIRQRTIHQKKSITKTYFCKEFRRNCQYGLVIRQLYNSEKSIVEERCIPHDHSQKKSSNLTNEVKNFILKNLDKTACEISRLLQVSSNEQF